MSATPNAAVVPIPDDLLESRAFATCDLLLQLQVEYGGLPVPLPHRAVLQVLDLVRAVGKMDSELLPAAEEWQAAVLGLREPGSMPTGVKSPAASTRPEHNLAGDLNAGGGSGNTHLPSYDRAIPGPCRMVPVEVAPVVDAGLELRPAPLVHLTIPVAPEMGDEHYHSLPSSPDALAVKGKPGVAFPMGEVTPPLRQPSPVEVSVNVSANMAGSSSSVVSVQTTLDMGPMSPHFVSVEDISPFQPVSPSPNLGSTATLDQKIDALVAAHLNRARHAAGLALEPVLFTLPAPDLPPLTSAAVIVALDQSELAAWVRYYLGARPWHACPDVLMACVGL